MKISMQKLALFFASALMLGCLGSEEGESSDSRGVVELGPEPISISVKNEFENSTYVITQNTIVENFKYLSCEKEGILEENTDEYTENYLIEGGTLYIWNEWSCSAMTFTGGGEKLEGGPWSYIGNSGIPNSEKDCSENDDFTPSANIQEFVIWKEGKKYYQYAGKWCWAEEFAKGENHIKANGCNFAESEYEGKIVSTSLLRWNFDDGSSTVKVSFEGRECTQNFPGYSEMTEAECKAAWNDYRVSDSYEPDQYFYVSEWLKSPKDLARATFKECLQSNHFPEEYISTILF